MLFVFGRYILLLIPLYVHGLCILQINLCHLWEFLCPYEVIVGRTLLAFFFFSWVFDSEEILTSVIA